jgi:hypothetical protein
MSARLNAGQFADWIVPASGTYRVYSSAALATHPWFRNPLAYGTFESRGAQIHLAGFRRPNLGWRIDDIAVAPTGVFHLKRGQHLRAMAMSGPLGVMIVPGGIRDLFQQPPHGVTLDAAAPPVTHFPFQ